MKKITFLLFLISSSVFSQTTLLDYESATTWTNFDGGVMTTETNPYYNADNNSANVGKMVKNANKTWGGSWSQLSSAIDFTNNNTITMKVHSPRVGAKVLFKVENASDSGISFQKEETTTVANAWETLTFDFSAINASNSYEKVVIIFDNGTLGDGTANFTFYVDDITLSNNSGGGGGVSTVVLQDFSNLKNIGNEDVYGGFGDNLSASNSLDDDPIDASNKVRTVTTTAGGNSWKGIFVRPQTHYIDLSSTKTVSIKVYSNTASYFKGKMQKGQSGQADIELATSESHSGGGWETLTFNFASAIGEWLEFVLFTSVDASGAYIDPPTEALTAYFDDITAAQGSAIPAPPAELTTPSPAINHSGTTGIISIYSDVLTNISGVNTNPSWNQSTTTTEVDINSSGNHALKYANLNYQGTDFNGNRQDVSSMTHFHLDYYTDNATALQFFLIDASGEQAYDIAASIGITTGSWQTLDIPLTNWNTTDLATIRQFKVVGDGTIYIDNLYFYNSATAGVDDNNFANLSMYPNPVSNLLTINADISIENATIYNVLGKKIMNVAINNNSGTIDVSSLNTGIYMLKYTSNNSVGTKKFIKE